MRRSVKTYRPCAVPKCDGTVPETWTSPYCESHRSRLCKRGDLQQDLPIKRVDSYKLLSSYPEYSIWRGMRHRCKSDHHRNYGGRGIRVCDRWNKFAEFLSDMGPRPSKKHSLERVDNSKGYGPDNCVWATSTEQIRNRRNTVQPDVAKVILEFRELGFSFVKISEMIGVDRQTVGQIVRKRHWTSNA